MDELPRVSSEHQELLLTLFEQCNEEFTVKISSSEPNGEYSVSDVRQLVEELELLEELSPNVFLITPKGLQIAKILQNKHLRKNILQKMTTEDYILALYYLTQGLEKKIVSMTSLARTLSLSNSTISEYIRTIEKEGLVSVKARKGVMLTEEGEKLAEQINHNRDVLMVFLQDILGIEPNQAEVESHILEHNISSDVIERLDKLNKQLTSKNINVR